MSKRDLSHCLGGPEALDGRFLVTLYQKSGINFTLFEASPSDAPSLFKWSSRVLFFSYSQHFQLLRINTAIEFGSFLSFFFMGGGKKWAVFFFLFFFLTLRRRRSVSRDVRLSLIWNWKTLGLKSNKQAIKQRSEQQQVLFVVVIYLFLPLTRLGKPRERRSVTPERKSNFALKGEEGRRSQRIQWAAV